LQLNLLNQTIVTVAFVSWPQNTSFSGRCGWRQTRRPSWNWSALGWPHKNCRNCCLLWQM